MKYDVSLIIRKKASGIAVLIFILMIFFPSLLLHAGDGKKELRFAEALGNLDVKSDQLIVVVPLQADSTQARLYTFARQAGRWALQTGPTAAMVGRNGFAPPGEKREGDGRTPAGLFPIEFAFGYAPSDKTAMPYRQATDKDLWVDDVDAPDYNQWVTRGRTSAKSYEEMKLPDQRYRHGLVIGYNRKPVVKGLGSAIFVHIWAENGKSTAGCVALEEAELVRIIAWLKPEKHPFILMGKPADLATMFGLEGLERAAKSGLPDDFVNVKEVIPSLPLDIRYYGSHNFIGQRIDGYDAPKCILTREAASALAKVQQDLAAFSLSLKAYDCYRPQRAVDHFVRWAKDLKDIRTKKEFYPTLEKKNLFKDGYIAIKSGHSRGSTIDLTIVALPLAEQAQYVPGEKLAACYLPAKQRFRDNSLDMGTGFDCFHELSHTANGKIGARQKRDRLLLKTIMEKQGFKNFEREWWHFTLQNEPFPETYFDFAID